MVPWSVTTPTARRPAVMMSVTVTPSSILTPSARADLA
jgi:hypothetical protein